MSDWEALCQRCRTVRRLTLQASSATNQPRGQCPPPPVDHLVPSVPVFKWPSQWRREKQPHWAPLQFLPHGSWPMSPGRSHSVHKSFLRHYACCAENCGQDRPGPEFLAQLDSSGNRITEQTGVQRSYYSGKRKNRSQDMLWEEINNNRSGLPCPLPEDLPDPGIKLVSLASLALAGRFFTTNTPWEASSSTKLTFRQGGALKMVGRGNIIIPKP